MSSSMCFFGVPFVWSILTCQPEAQHPDCVRFSKSPTSAPSLAAMSGAISGGGLAQSVAERLADQIQVCPGPASMRAPHHSLVASS